MLQLTVFAFVLWSGVLVEPFRVAEAEPGHHQGKLRAAMASDGRFALAWLDKLRIADPPFYEEELFVRFFDSDGSPLTDAYKITKAADTHLIGGSHLDMDSQGNTVLAWTEYVSQDPDDGLLRLQLFDTSGSALDSYQIDPQGYINRGTRAVAVSLNDQAEFAVAWDSDTICARRYSFDGGPQGESFRVHDQLPDDFSSLYPGVALNDAGDLVVTWLENLTAEHLYPRFQVFDADDEPIDWEPLGHRIDDGEDEDYHGDRPEVHWLDDDRFVVFWKDWRAGHPDPSHPAGRVFSDRGLTRHPIRWLIWRDSLWFSHGGPEGWYSTAVAPNDSFAYTHMRTHFDYPDPSDSSEKRYWDHGGAILGYVADNQPIRWTNLFEYTPDWGADTIDPGFSPYLYPLPPAVACSDDRIVWMYSRPNTDTIFKAFALVTDWDMGASVAEQPTVQSPIELQTSINRLSYDLSGEAELTIYSVDGRRVLSEPIQNHGTWTPSSQPSSHLPSGVYFARVSSGDYTASGKVIVIH